MSLNNSEKPPTEGLILKCLHSADEFKLFALWTKCLQLCSKHNMPLTSLQKCPEYENLSKFLKSMLESFKAVDNELPTFVSGSGTPRHHEVKEVRKTSISSAMNDNSRRIGGVNTQTQTR